MSDNEKILITAISTLLISCLIIYWAADPKPVMFGKKTAGVAEAVQIKSIKAELEITNKGDILETRWEGEWEGSYQLMVVVHNFMRNDKRHDTIHYQTIGPLATQNMTTIDDLVHRVVKVYRVDTPEWKEKAQQFVRQK